MNKLEIFLKRNSSTILTFVSAAGVVATTVVAVKSTPKALSLINDAEEIKGDKLTIGETVKVAWKPYIPAAITGLSTIFCIFGINYLNSKKQASLMSAYALLDRTYKQYQNKVKNMYGEDAELNIKQEVINSKFDESMEISDDKLLFYDYQSEQFFEDTIEHVMQAECAFLEMFHDKGYACINEFHDMLGIPRVDYGYTLGWVALENNDPYDCHELTFDMERIVIGNDGRECFVISPSVPASYDYII